MAVVAASRGSPQNQDECDGDDGGWLQDVALLDRLVTEKLKAEAETIAAEGWKWISVAVDFSYGRWNPGTKPRFMPNIVIWRGRTAGILASTISTSRLQSVAMFRRYRTAQGAYTAQEALTPADRGHADGARLQNLVWRR